MGREKVISGLHDIGRFIAGRVEFEQVWNFLWTIDDAIAMLKEQEAKTMIENERGWNCPACGMRLIGKTASGYPCDLFDLPEDEPIHFCPMCGQAVKWE